MKVAFIIPCLNEQSSVAGVVRDCLAHMPTATVYVLDNNSSDRTASEAARAGAQVIHSPLRGKGNVIRHALRVLDADYFVMIDGDGTYPVEETQALLEIAQTHNYEMVMGSRLELGEAAAFRPLHYLGNRGLTWLVRLLFRVPVRDLLSGFRVFSRRFAAEIHIVSRGFELETELTVRSIAQDLAFCEVPIHYARRGTTSLSKLRTFRDGWKILRTIVRFWRDFRPMHYFTTLAALSLGAWALAPVRALNLFAMLGTAFLVTGFYLECQLDWLKLRRRQVAYKETRDTQPAAERTAFRKSA